MDLNQFVASVSGKYIDKYFGVASTVQSAEPFGGQCASLASSYLWQVCGRARGKSNGDATNYQNLAGATRIPANVPGCICVYPDLARPWGHVGIGMGGNRVLDQNPHRARISDDSHYGRKVYMMPNELQNQTNQQNQGGIGMFACIVWIDDDHAGYKKGTGCLWTPANGVVPLESIDCVRVMNTISQHYTGKPLPEFHSSAQAPWVLRLAGSSIMSVNQPLPNWARKSS